MKITALPRAALAAALLAAALWGLLELSGTLQAWQRLQRTQQESALIALHLADAHALALRNRAELEKSMQAAGAPAAQIAAIQTNMERLSQHWDFTQQFIRDAQEGQLAATVATQRWQYLQQGLLPTLAAMDQAAGARVPQLAAGALQLFEPFGQSLGKLLHVERQRAEREQASSRQRLQSALLVFAMLAGLLLLLGWTLQYLLARSKT